MFPLDKRSDKNQLEATVVLQLAKNLILKLTDNSPEIHLLSARLFQDVVIIKCCEKSVNILFIHWARICEMLILQTEDEQMEMAGSLPGGYDGAPLHVSHPLLPTLHLNYR